MPKIKTITAAVIESLKGRNIFTKIKKKKNNTLDLDEKIIKGIYAFLESPFKK